MNRRQALAGGLAAAALLPGCATMAPISQALTPIGEATGVLTPAGAVSLYGIAKGMAEVALIADPGLSLVVKAALAIAAPLLADIQARTATAAASAVALTRQANALQLATAGAITVHPNGVGPLPSTG